MSIVIQNSWYLNKPLAECKNLFQEVTWNYQAHFYHCQCGCQEVIVSSNMQTPSYECEECGNDHFVNAYNAMKSDFYLQNEDIHYLYKCAQTKDGFEANAYLDVPVDTDFMRKCMIFKKRNVEHFEISFDGGQKEKVTSFISSDMQNILGKKLKRYILDNYDDPRNVLKVYGQWVDEEDKLEVILFFLAHPNFLDFKFYFWKLDANLRGVVNPKNPITIDEMLGYLLNHRKERSLKRALFKKYTQCFWHIEHRQRLYYDTPYIYSFDPMTPFVISRCFDDPNIASKLFAEDFALFEYCNEEYDGRNYKLHDLIWLIMFLKKYYSEKQIAKLLLSVGNALDIWLDILVLVPGHKRTIKKYFEKVKLSVKNLHDEIIRSTSKKENKMIGKVKLSYEPKYKHACIKMDGMEFKLPEMGKELIMWANYLHNCMSGYIFGIKERHTTIFGVFKADKLLYAIEISNSLIMQMSGKYNSEIPIEDKQLIDKWWEKYFGIEEQYEDPRKEVI